MTTPEYLYEITWQMLLENDAHQESMADEELLRSHLRMSKKEYELLWCLNDAEILALCTNQPEETALLPVYFNEIRQLLPKLQPHCRADGDAVGATITIRMSYLIYLTAHLRHAKNLGGENVRKTDLMRILTLLDTGTPARILPCETMSAPLPEAEAEAVSIHLVLQLLEQHLDEYIVRSQNQAIAWSVARGHIDDYRDTALGDFGNGLMSVAWWFFCSRSAH